MLVCLLAAGLYVFLDPHREHPDQTGCRHRKTGPHVASHAIKGWVWPQIHWSRLAILTCKVQNNRLNMIYLISNSVYKQQVFMIFFFLSPDNFLRILELLVFDNWIGAGYLSEDIDNPWTYISLFSVKIYLFHLWKKIWGFKSKSRSHLYLWNKCAKFLQAQQMGNAIFLFH